MSALSLSAKSANICIVDNEILKLASSPRMERKRSSLDSVGSNTSLSCTLCRALYSLSTAADLACNGRM